jgi:DNA-binding transcriptional ArsR family regulator
VAHDEARTESSADDATGSYAWPVIEFRLGPADLCRTRFAYSPLAELTAGLHALSSGAVHPLHRPWLNVSRAELRAHDVALLRTVVPPRPQLAEFLYGSLHGRDTTIDDQLDAVAELPVDQLRADLVDVWAPAPLPPLLEEVLADGAAGARRIADALRACWTATIGPHWPRLRSVLDADVAYRAERLTHGGSEAMLADLHPQVRLVGDTVRIEKRFDHRRDLTGQGLILVPSIFTWPRVIVAGEEPNQPSLTYAARGIASTWDDGETTAAEDPLAALIGRTRATILRLLDVPHSPTQLAARLDQSPSSASQHLTVLRRSGLATARRQGRQMLYRRTPLADGLLASGADSAHRSA